MEEISTVSQEKTSTAQIHKEARQEGDCSKGMGYQASQEGHDDLGKEIKLHCFPLQHTATLHLGQASIGIVNGTFFHYLKDRNCY